MVYARTVLLSLTLVAGSNVLAFPFPAFWRRQAAITQLSTVEIDQFSRFSHYAGAASCDADVTGDWSCGEHCDANSDFVPSASGGNGATVQFWYVGFDPTLQSVIVGHQGTDPAKVIPLINDADIRKDPLDAELFPGVPEGVEVHSGFKESQEDTATDILAAVKQSLADNGVNKITVAGWSLGGAIAILDGIYLRLQLPDADVEVYGYGMPRVGNEEWTAFVDQTLAGKVFRVTNKDDVVPILPGRFLGFHHVSGERHIKDDDSWVNCPGQDNTDAQCSTGQVKNIFEGEVDEHFGPYNGILLSC